MDKTISIIDGDKEIKIFDLDHESEVEMCINYDKHSWVTMYLNEEDLISLSNHIMYLLKKMPQ